MRASELDFSTVRFFAPHEFPSDVLQFLDARLVKKIDEFRAALGYSLVPSPLRAGWVREGGSKGSRHYIGQVRRADDGGKESQRLSTAGDLFPSLNCDIRHALMTALRMGFGGIGIYLDTHGPTGLPQPMIHVDLREGTPQLWLRDEDGYLYPYRGDAEMDLFFRKLSGVTAT